VALPPGPRQPRLVQVARWIARPTEYMESAFRSFGDFVTLKFPDVDAVAVSDPELIKTVFTGDPEIFRAGESNSFLEPVVGDSSVLLLDGPRHIRERRLLLPPFHGERMQRYRELIDEIAERDIDGWPLGHPFAVRPRTQAITLEVIMRAVFGIEDAVRLSELRSALTRLTDIGGNRLRWIGLLMPALQRSFGTSRSPWSQFVAAREMVDALLYDEIGRRRRDPALEEREDILSLLLQARDEDGEPMSDKELRDELMTLLVAGHETTATALAWAFELLLRNPPALARLEQELSEGGEDYLDAVIKETLRLRPVLPIVGRLLSEPVTLRGYELPAGTVVAPCIYLTHRNPAVYPEPERFLPERFLETQPDTYAWLPFGGGIRRCIGASFAIFEMKVVIPAVLSRLRLRAVGSRPEPMRRRAITFVPARDALVVAERREEPLGEAPERAPALAA
jgi:cytochrome P450 family 135